jgi:hypothetical protein
MCRGYFRIGDTVSIPGWPSSVEAGTPIAERNTLRTYLKAGILSIVLGIPFGFGLSIGVPLVGFYAGWGLAVWIAGRIFGLKGKAAHVLAYVATVGIAFLISVAFLFSQQDRIKEILDQAKPVGLLFGSTS